MKLRYLTLIAWALATPLMAGEPIVLKYSDLGPIELPDRSKINFLETAGLTPNMDVNAVKQFLTKNGFSFEGDPYPEPIRVKDVEAQFEPTIHRITAEKIDHSSEESIEFVFSRPLPTSRIIELNRKIKIKYTDVQNRIPIADFLKKVSDKYGQYLRTGPRSFDWCYDDDGTLQVDKKKFLLCYRRKSGFFVSITVWGGEPGDAVKPEELKEYSVEWVDNTLSRAEQNAVSAAAEKPLLEKKSVKDAKDAVAPDLKL